MKKTTLSLVVTFTLVFVAGYLTNMLTRQYEKSANGQASTYRGRFHNYEVEINDTTRNGSLRSRFVYMEQRLGSKNSTQQIRYTYNDDDQINNLCIVRLSDKGYVDCSPELVEKMAALSELNGAIAALHNQVHLVDSNQN